ncbi:hypothetical protein QBC45DRAFT_453234 [Copromyces sp. CBS 386.78]|nr:hypothetical protein QBC45DRAFT_453234 [Copromyces sp. CBS 386.78]
MESLPTGQSDAFSSSSLGSSKQSFQAQPPEPPISATYSRFPDDGHNVNNPSPDIREKETETKVYIPPQQLSPAPLIPPSPKLPHRWHPTTNPGLSNNHRYQLATTQEGEREGNFFPYPRIINEPSCPCLPPLLVTALLNLAAGIKATAGRICEFLKTGADWVPPVPPESESESEDDLERGLARRKRGRGWKWKGPPPPIFVPMSVLSVFQGGQIWEEEAWGWEHGQEREVPLRQLGDGINVVGKRGVSGRYREVEDEGSDDDVLDREVRRKKKWKGKGKAVDAEGSSGRRQGDPGKLRSGTYVPVEPDRRGTVWQPGGVH